MVDWEILNGVKVDGVNICGVKMADVSCECIMFRIVFCSLIDRGYNEYITTLRR